jgi:hypothetical protein
MSSLSTRRMDPNTHEKIQASNESIVISLNSLARKGNSYTGYNKFNFHLTQQKTWYFRSNSPIPPEGLSHD